MVRHLYKFIFLLHFSHAYFIDKIGLHRISNPNKEKGAVSLHLYTPPYKVCKTFEEKTGKARSSGVCSFYSIGGNRI
jgi:cysteine dioxygenase